MTVTGASGRRDEYPTAMVAPQRAFAVEADGTGSGLVRLALHLTLAGLPLLAISAHVFGVLPMHLAAALVVLPLTVATVLLVVFDPIAEERIVLRGAVWGAFATAVYDVFRLDTVYLLGWWGDFIPTMGTWVVGADPGDTTVGAIAGYLWRYLGDGPGIGAVFFVLVAATGLRRLGRGTVVGVAIAFAVFPVWAGLVGTVGLAPNGQEQMFPLTATTVTLSLVGHLIFGLVLGLGCARAPGLEDDWPHPPLCDVDAIAGRLRGGRPSGDRHVLGPPALSRPEAPSRPELERAAEGPRVLDAHDRGPASGGLRVEPRASRPDWWDAFPTSVSIPVLPPEPVELTMPAPPPRTPPGGFPVLATNRPPPVPPSLRSGPASGGTRPWPPRPLP